MDLDKLTSEAKRLLAHYKLAGWTFRLNTNRSRLGVCRYRHKRVEVQTYYAQNNPESEVMDTLLHEIAHAIVGPGHGHDSVWKLKAMELGCSGERCGSPGVKVPEGDYKARCPTCQKVYTFHRQPKLGRKFWCTHCGREKGILHFDPLREVVPMAKRDAAWKDKFSWYQRIHPEGHTGKWIKCACHVQQMVNIIVSGWGKEEEKGMKTRIAQGFRTADLEELGIMYELDGFIVFDRELPNQPVQKLAPIPKREGV